MIRGQFIGSGGVLKVGLDRLVSEKFGISRSEANRLIADGEVTIDGEVTHRKDIEVERCEFVKATGARCRRLTTRGKCWHHREENLRPRLEHLHALAADHPNPAKATAGATNPQSVEDPL